jgi:hypothetical protein
LEELYRQTAPDHRLTLAAYEDFGRLRGAISRRATALLEELRKTEGEALDAALPLVFQALVHVDAAGTATRRRAFRDELGDTASIPMIIDKLVRGRLLAAEDADGRSTVTLAHEALISEWPALHEWLDRNRVLLQRVQTLITALGDADMEVRRSAARALVQIGLAAVPALITTLGDPDKEVRRSAVRILGQIQHRSSCNFELFTPGSERTSLRLTGMATDRVKPHDTRSRHPAQGHEHQR